MKDFYMMINIQKLRASCFIEVFVSDSVVLAEDGLHDVAGVLERQDEVIGRVLILDTFYLQRTGLEGMVDQLGDDTKGILNLFLILLLEGKDGVERLVGLLEV